MDFLDVNSIFFTIFDYPMSYLEFFGTVFYAISVWQVAKRNIWTWPTGLIGVALFMVLFYKIQLYSDFFEQIYYLITGVYGWYLWARFRKANTNGDKSPAIQQNTVKQNLMLSAIVVVAALMMTGFISNIHIWFPHLFVEPASYPLLDAFTTVLSFAAQLLMSHRKIENWILWIVVDIIGIFLYAAKEVRFLALLYVVFLFMALYGLYQWNIELKSEKLVIHEG